MNINQNKIIGYGYDGAKTFANVNSGTEHDRVVSLNTGTDKAYIGAQVHGGQPWEGRISEHIGFNRKLTTQEQQKIEGYLAHKWNITNLLPATHPYKQSPPTV